MLKSETKLFNVQINKVCTQSIDVRVPNSISDESTIERMIVDAINESSLDESDFVDEHDEFDTSSIVINQIESNHSYFENMYGSKLISLDGSLHEYEDYGNVPIIVENIDVDSK